MIVSGTIDYEVQSVYQLTITVTGLGLSTSKVLTVNVIDVNEAHNISNLPASITVPAPSTAADTEVYYACCVRMYVNIYIVHFSNIKRGRVLCRFNHGPNWPPWPRAPRGPELDLFTVEFYSSTIFLFIFSVLLLKTLSHL